MEKLASRDGLHASEVQVFQAVLRWGASQAGDMPLRLRIAGLLAKTVRFPCMSAQDLHSVVEEANVADPALLLEAYRYHALGVRYVIPPDRAWAFLPRTGTLRIGPLRQFGPCAILEDDGCRIRHNGRQVCMCVYFQLLFSQLLQPNWGGCVLAEPALTEGRTYWEVLISSGGMGGHVRLGLATRLFSVSAPMEYLGRNSSSLGLYSNGSSVACQGLHSQAINSIIGWRNGDRVGLLLEFHEQRCLLVCKTCLSH